MKKIFLFPIFLLSIGLLSQTVENTEFDTEFKDFWCSTIDDLNEIPFAVRKLKSEEFQGKNISLYKVKSYNQIDFHIYVSEPKKKGKYETRIMFSPFGKQEYSFNEIASDYFMTQEDVISVKVDNRGQGLSNDVIKNERFILNGIVSKETYVYRGVFMDVIRAVDFISMHEKSNGVIIAFGGSQGGMLALVASALNPKIDIAIVRIPFFAGINNYNMESWPMRWILTTSMPERGITKQKQLNELAFYDVKYFAKLLDIPIFIGSCENDPITPYRAILDAFVNISNNDKMIYVVPCFKHGYRSVIDEDISQLFLEHHLKIIYKEKGID